MNIDKIIDLSNSEDQTVTLTVNREALYDNTVGFYRVNGNGSVTDPTTGATILPGEAGYAEAALANRLDVSLSTPNQEETEFSVDFTGGDAFGSFIVSNGSFEELSDDNTANDPNVYFSFSEANADNFDHVVNLSENTLGFEDLPNGGDADFNDITVEFDGLAFGDKPEPTPEPELEPKPTDPGDDGINTGTASIQGIKFNDLNGNGVRDSELVQGENPDVVFVIDVSTSAEDPFQGTSVGDVNEDDIADSILDAEIAGFIGLNQQLIDQGLGDSADLGVIAFSLLGTQIDLNSQTSGVQAATTPNANSDNNGIPDVEDALSSLQARPFTSFEAALQTAEEFFNSLGTEPGNGNLVFFSDGENLVGGDINDEVERLNNLGVNLSAFGAGENASLEDLQIIDPDAEIFTSTDEILDVFAGLGTAGGGESQSELEPGLEGVNIYLDLNNNGSLDNGEPSQVTDENGQYVFSDLAAGTYSVREVVPDGSSQTAPIDEQFTIELGTGETIEDIDFGNILIAASDTSEIAEI